MAGTTVGVRSLPRLPSSAWWVLSADALSAVGTGLALPFLMIYLNSVHGFGFGLAGAVLAVVGLACVVGNPLGGWLADRVGPRRALLAALPLAAIGTAGWIVVSGPATAFAAAVVSGLGLSMSLPAQGALLAVLVGPGQRSAVFAVGNGTLNVGLAVGGLLAAVVVDAGRPETFLMVYALDAATFVLAATMIASLRTTVRAAPGRRGVRPGRGYRAVARDRVLVAVWLLTACLATVGFGQFNSVMPVLAIGHGGLAVSDLGLVLAANTVAVVAAQLVVLRVLAGRGRVGAVALIGPLWAVSWVLMLAAGAFDAGGALVVFLVAAAVFGLGETLLWPTLPVIVNDLAPDDLRGRYNGAFVLALTTGSVVGPVLGAAALARGRAAELLVVLAVVCAGSAVAAVGLRRLVPPGIDRVAGRREGAGSMTEIREPVLERHRLGAACRRRGDYPAAERHLRAALELAAEHLPPDAPEVLLVLNELGVTFKYSGRFDEAVELYGRALAAMEALLGPEHEAIATIHHNLGGLEHARGDFAAAEAPARRAVAIRERALGPDHPRVAADRAALAPILDGLGRRDEAEALLRQALATYERLDDRYEIAVTLNNLGALTFRTGRAEEARDLLGRALAMKELVLGTDHPELAPTVNNLAVVHQRLGELAAARALYERAVAILEPAVEPTDPTLVGCRARLAGLGMATGVSPM